MAESELLDSDIEAVAEAVLRNTGAERYGVTEKGYVAKPYARLLAESLALAQRLFGADIDLEKGSVLRRILELTALENARTHADLARVFDDMYATTARGAQLSAIGEELGLPRPFLNARGRLTLTLAGDPPASGDGLSIPRGARLGTAGGHHVALTRSVRLTAAARTAEVEVEAFYPGPEHNLDPAEPSQRIDRWNPADETLETLRDLAQDQAMPPEALVTLTHEQPLRGGEARWPDGRYRELVLRAPRSLWTVAAMRGALARLPGVRQVQIEDAMGGLDIDRSIFGNFNFIERVFAAERDLASPYYFTVLVAPTPAAIWDGPDGLRAIATELLQDLRPIGIFPDVRQAQEVGVGVAANLIVEGLPLPTGAPSTVNASGPAVALKRRLLERIQLYIDGLAFGVPVRAAEVSWAIMNEPGIADVQDLRLVRYPVGLGGLDFDNPVDVASVDLLARGQNVTLEAQQIAVLVDDDTRLTIV